MLLTIVHILLAGTTALALSLTRALIPNPRSQILSFLDDGKAMTYHRHHVHACLNIYILLVAFYPPLTDFFALAFLSGGCSMCSSSQCSSHATLVLHLSMRAYFLTSILSSHTDLVLLSPVFYVHLVDRNLFLFACALWVSIFVSCQYRVATDEP